MYRLIKYFNSYLLAFTVRKKIFITCVFFLFFSVAYPPKIIEKRISGSWEPIEKVVQHFLNEKIQNPWKLVHGFGDESHFAKRDLRVTPYLIGSLFQIEAIKLFYLQVLLFPFFIYFLVVLLHRFSKDGLTTFYGLTALLFSYVGNSFFFDTLFLDSLGYFGLLASFFFLRSPLLFPWLLITFFVDERAIVPALILPLSTFLRYSIPKTEQSIPIFIKEAIWKNRTFWIIVVTIFSYLAIRYVLFQKFGLTTPVGLKNGVSPIVASKFGLKALVAYFSGLKASLFLIFWAIFLAFRTQDKIIASWIYLVFLLVSFISLSVEDITRSFAYGFPIVLVAFQYLFWIEKNGVSKWRKEIRLMAFVSILIPTYTLILDLVRIEAFPWLIK